MHMALRNRSDRPMQADGKDVMPEVRAQLAKMREFVTGVHQGRILGFTGARFTDVVNIGIGGSDLGPRMAVAALAIGLASGFEDGRPCVFSSAPQGRPKPSVPRGDPAKWQSHICW